MIFLFTSVSSPVHFWTYERDFLSQYCQAWVRLELDTHLAQQALREALDTKEVLEARERLNRITELSHVRSWKQNSCADLSVLSRRCYPHLSCLRAEHSSSVCFSFSSSPTLWLIQAQWATLIRYKDLYFLVLLASGCGVEGCSLDYGLSTVRSVQAVGGGSASGSGDGRRPAATSRWWGRGGEFDCQTDVAQSDTGTESHYRYKRTFCKATKLK